MSKPVYDQQLANAATAAQQCMTLGAVILRPSSVAPVGFTSATTHVNTDGRPAPRA